MIASKADIIKFADLINTSAHVHQVFLAERSKYVQGVKNRHVKTEICHHLSPLEFFKVVKSMEAFVENKECSVIYCTTNPRSSRKAARKFMEAFHTAIFDQNNTFIENIATEWSSTLMSSKGNHRYTTIDIDEMDLYPKVVNVFDERKVPFVEVKTRGGYHLLFEDNSIVPSLKKFEQNIGDVACPIPGTFQGGHQVTMKSS